MNQIDLKNKIAIITGAAQGFGYAIAKRFAASDSKIILIDKDEVALSSAIKNDDINIRVGIHIGDIVFDDDDVYGDGVNIASRIESLAPVGGILISKNVYDELINKDDFEGIYLGLQSLKGVGRLIEVYALKDSHLTVPSPDDYKDTKIDVHTDDEVPSIAIIPFRNKGKEEDAFYAYGISADLISDCSGAGLIRVASLEDIEKVEHWDKLKADELASTLLVRYIAQGTLWKMDDMFQLSVELYDTKDKKVVWSDRWQEKWDNLISIKANLSDGLLKALDTIPIVEKHIETENTTAYEYYLKGKHKFYYPDNKEDRVVAIGLLNKAIALDANLFEAKCIVADAQPTIEKQFNMIKSNIKEAKRLGNKYVLARSYNSEGWKYWTLSRNELAITSFKKAIEIYEEINNKHEKSIALNGLGYVYSFLGLSGDSINSFFESIKIAEEIGDKNGLFHRYTDLALIYIFQDEFKDAIQTWENSNNYSDPSNTKMGIALNYYVKGRIDLWKGDYRSSVSNIKEAYELFDIINDKTNYVWTFSWYVLARIMKEDGNVIDDLNLIHKRIEEGWVLDIDYPDVYYTLYKIYKILEDSKKSQSFLDLCYKKINQLSERIEKTEYKKSYLESKWISMMISDWEANNKN